MQAKAMIRQIIEKLFGSRKKQTGVRDYEWERFRQTAKEQFVRLKEKGLSIPVVTL